MNIDEWDGKTIHQITAFICVHLWLDTLLALSEI